MMNQVTFRLPAGIRGNNCVSVKYWHDCEKLQGLRTTHFK